MERVALLLLFIMIMFSASGCGNMGMPKADIHLDETVRQTETSIESMASSSEVDELEGQGREEGTGLNLSEYYIKISADGNEAVFQLYDTAAAEKLYEQLPLELDTENFRNAQWMFYPPERLPVTAAEAYHDGIKGELSYYEPWGDVFVLYEDFYAGDEMHKLGICTSGIEYLEGFDSFVTLEKLELTSEDEGGDKMEKQIRFSINGNEIVFALNDSAAANSLYEQLPIQVEISDYSNLEK